MAPVDIEELAVLRAVVGFLGERDHYGWWQSSFFSAGSSAFLTPIFARTQVLAQCNGVTQAAATLHDERIGVGRVFHLFRLPEDMEQDIHRALYSAAVTNLIDSYVRDRSGAQTYLEELADSTAVDSGIGPIHIGSANMIRESKPWLLVAKHYADSFAASTQRFPYFTESNA